MQVIHMFWFKINPCHSRKTDPFLIEHNYFVYDQLKEASHNIFCLVKMCCRRPLSADMSFSNHKQSNCEKLIVRPIYLSVSNSKTKVSNDTASISTNQNIFRFNVTMSDCWLALSSKYLRVKMNKSCHCRYKHLHRLCFG